MGEDVSGFSRERSIHATHATVPVSQLIRKPASLSWEVAGALYAVGYTAYAAVTRHTRRFALLILAQGKLLRFWELR